MEPLGPDGTGIEGGAFGGRGILKKRRKKEIYHHRRTRRKLANSERGGGLGDVESH